MRRINKTEEDKTLAIRRLESHLRLRKYPQKTFKDEKEKNPVAVEPKKIIFCTQFHPSAPNYQKIWENTSRILGSHPTTECLTKYRFIVAFRNCPSLNDLLTSSRLHSTNLPKGSQKCEGCYLCPFITTTNSQSSVNNFNLNIHEALNCKTVSVVYLITCNRCSIQYIGETGNTLNQRFRGHLQDIRENLGYKPVGTHFNLPGHTRNDLRITLLRKTPDNDSNWRKRTEEALIRQFGTSAPKGLNIKEH
jgi:hypothetical protein